MRKTSIIAAVCGLLCSPLFAQTSDSCSIPPTLLAHREATIFSEKQEADLGDAMEERLAGTLRLVRGAQNDYLRKVGDRLVRQLPPNELGFKFQLVEASDSNAITFPGGRIFVTRKLVTQAKNEDELATVLAHEIGHAYLRHSSATFTKLLEQVLNVRTVGDRKDIFEKVHRLAENMNLKIDDIHVRNMDELQDEADTLAAFLAARAGYRPEAFADYYDRLAETKGKTGNAFSNFFGSTPPDQKRLRNIRKLIQRLPSACHSPEKVDVSGFSAWRQLVLADDRVRAETTSANLQRSLTLRDPLLADVRHFRFSPNGTYLLSQDEFGINVLQRSPLKWLFRIPAEDAYPAHFSVDSHTITFHNEDLRVETWDIATAKRIAVNEVNVPAGCVRSEITADGKFLACITSTLAVRLIETETGAIRFEDKSTVTLDFIQAFVMSILGPGAFTNARFSPDGHYLLYRVVSNTEGVDVTTGKKLHLPSKIKKLMMSSFDFQGNDRLLGVDPENMKSSAIVSFPDGRILQQLTLGNQVTSATRGDFIMVRPVRDFAVGVVSVKDNKILFANRESALDVFDSQYVSERKNGEIGLYEFNTGQQPKPLETLTLPPAEISRVRAFAISPDARFAAYSTRTRGAIWDLQTGERRMIVRPFESATFEGHRLLATFFYDKHERRLLETQSQQNAPGPATPPRKDGDDDKPARVLLAIDLNNAFAEKVRVVDDSVIEQHGSFVAKWADPEKKKGDGTELQVSRFLDDSSVWKRNFPKGRPAFTSWNPAEDTVAFVWLLVSDEAKFEVKNDPQLQARAKQMKDKYGDLLVEVVRLSSGQSLGKVLIETGQNSFHLHNLSASSDQLAVAVSDNRVLVYGYDSGTILGRVFGDRPVLSSKTHSLGVRTDLNTLSVFNSKTFDKDFDSSFGANLVNTTFLDQGGRVIVLTADQQIHILENAKQSASVH